MAALPTICPVVKFSDETTGRVAPVGYAVRNPLGPETFTTVKFNEYALALAGMPGHGPPGMLNVRAAPPPTSAGPPYGPTGVRVSTIRHGTTVMKCEAAEGTAFTEGCRERSAIRRGSVSITFARICSNGTRQSFSGTA